MNSCCFGLPGLEGFVVAAPGKESDTMLGFKLVSLQAGNQPSTWCFHFLLQNHELRNHDASLHQLQDTSTVGCSVSGQRGHWSHQRVGEGLLK